MTDDGKSTAAIKPLERNYFQEAQRYNVRNWKKVDPRSHPLSLMYTAVIQDLGKTGKSQRNAIKMI